MKYPKEKWKESNLTEEQMKMLILKISEKCDAVALVDGKACCLVELLFGHEAKPGVCKKFKCKAIRKE